MELFADMHCTPGKLRFSREAVCKNTTVPVRVSPASPWVKTQANDDVSKTRQMYNWKK